MGNIISSYIFPLYFISREHWDFRLIHISNPAMDLGELYELGMCTEKAVEEAMLVPQTDMVCFRRSILMKDLSELKIQ